VVQQHTPGCRMEQGGQAGQYHIPAEQFLLGKSVLLPAAGSPLVSLPSPVTTCRSQQQATPSSPSPWENGVAGTLCKSKYLCSRGLPSPALYFLPLLKMSQISCFHNCAGNEFPAGWQLSTSMCWVCCGCTPHLCSQLLHPPSTFREWIWPERRWDRVRDMGTELHDYGSPSCSSEEPLCPGPRVRLGSRETRHTVYATSEQTSKPD